MKKSNFLAILLFAISVSLTSCSSDDDGGSNNGNSYNDWNQYRGSISKSGFSSSSAPSETPIDLTDGDFLNTSANEGVTGSPIIANGKLYIVTSVIGGGENLSAFNLNNGDLIWRYSLGANILPPTVNDGMIYFASSSDNEVIALSSNDGSEIWRTNVSIGSSSPTFQNGILFVDNVALDTNTGQVLWQFDASINGSPNATLLGAGSYSPSINNDLVFYSGQEQFPDYSRKEFIYAVNINTGNEVWRFEIDNIEWTQTSIIPISDNILYFNTNNSTNSYRYAVDATTGEEIWKLENSTYTHNESSPAIGYGKVIINMYGGLYAFDKITGQEVWNFSPSDSDSSNNPIIADNKVFIAGHNYLYAIDVNSGTELWKSDVYSGGLFNTEPVISGGKVIYTNGISLSILE